MKRFLDASVLVEACLPHTLNVRHFKHVAPDLTVMGISDLTHLNAEIDAGKKFTLPQVVRMHEALKAEGL